MPNKSKSKRKRRENGAAIHPRNRYADNPPDFSLLASLYPSFSDYVFYSGTGRARIDWTDFNATRELTRVLLLHDHGLTWWIPDGLLCPTVPNRSNYIHWIEDLLASDIIAKTNSEEDKVRGFDIGTGANCIYPLLGASLLGWSFVGSDVTDIALEWAEKNVKSNPHISELIKIRKVDNAVVGDGDGILGLNSLSAAEHDQSNIAVSNVTGPRQVDDTEEANSEEKPGIGPLVNDEENVDTQRIRDGIKEPLTSNLAVHQLIENKVYNGPPILLGVVKDGEMFDFCMCNPPFFESMEEAGRNPRTSCGGTPEEMVCSGGERAFICRIIEDSVALKQSFRWYTSMVGKKSNLKFLISKLRQMGVTVVKTTEFVQGQTCRWGLAWSFMPPFRKLVPSHSIQKSKLSFILEGFQRHTTAFSVLQSVESFFCSSGASCKLNQASFTVDIKASSDHCDAIMKNDSEGLKEAACCQNVAEMSSLQDPASCLSICISVFQQIPGTLLVRGSLQQRDSPLSDGMRWSLCFINLEAKTD